MVSSISMEEEEQEEVVSVFDVSDEPPSARAVTQTHLLLGDLASSTPRSDASLSWETGTGMWSTASSARTSARHHTDRENPDDPTDSTVLSGSLATMLQRLTTDSEDALNRSVRRMLQLGTVLAGGDELDLPLDGLSDEEIRALPKVRFESAEQQHCSICLEAYQEGELLTALHCSHFFHIECLARWMQRATICPLCRCPCGHQ
jgi:hypothetical protein